MNTTLVNMYLIEVPNGRVLVHHQLPRHDNAWAILTFPGGHVEPGESVTAATIRMEWMTLEQVRAGQMEPNMGKYLRVFIDNQGPRCFGFSGRKLHAISL